MSDFSENHQFGVYMHHSNNKQSSFFLNEVCHKFSVAKAHVNTVYFDCGDCRRDIFDFMTIHSPCMQKHTNVITINDTHMCLWHTGTVAHFVQKNLDCSHVSATLELWHISFRNKNCFRKAIH